MYLLAVFPTRSYLLQRSQVKNTIAQVKAVKSSNEAIQQEINALNSPSEIGRIARSQYGLVMPGEKAFVVLPPSTVSNASTNAKTTK